MLDTSFVPLLLVARGTPGAVVTIKTNGCYGYIDADDVDRVAGLCGSLPREWRAFSGAARWVVVDAMVGQDALVERVA